VIDVQDAYPNVMEDLQTLKAERKFGCSQILTHEKILFTQMFLGFPSKLMMIDQRKKLKNHLVKYKKIKINKEHHLVR